MNKILTKFQCSIEMFFRKLKIRGFLDSRFQDLSHNDFILQHNSNNQAELR